MSSIGTVSPRHKGSEGIEQEIVSVEQEESIENMFKNWVVLTRFLAPHQQKLNEEIRFRKLSSSELSDSDLCITSITLSILLNCKPNKEKSEFIFNNKHPIPAKHILSLISLTINDKNVDLKGKLIKILYQLDPKIIDILIQQLSFNDIAKEVRVKQIIDDLPGQKVKEKEFENLIEFFEVSPEKCVEILKRLYDLSPLSIPRALKLMATYKNNVEIMAAINAKLSATELFVMTKILEFVDLLQKEGNSEKLKGIFSEVGKKDANMEKILYKLATLYFKFAYLGKKLENKQ